VKEGAQTWDGKQNAKNIPARKGPGARERERENAQQQLQFERPVVANVIKKLKK